MSSEMIVVRRARDLDPAARAWVASLFGHDIPDDQEISVALGALKHVPTAEERRAANERLDQLLAEIHQRVKDVPEEEMEEALDEAMQHVRPSYRRR